MECRACGAPADFACKWRYWTPGRGLLGLLDQLIWWLTPLTPLCLACLDKEVHP